MTALMLPDPAAIATEDIPAVLGDVEHFKASLWVRLMLPPSLPTNADDLIDDVDEVARITRHSVSWVRKHGHQLPGFTQPGGKGTRVAWRRAALEAWASGTT